MVYKVDPYIGDVKVESANGGLAQDALSFSNLRVPLHKIVFDKVFAAGALLFFAPFLVLIAILILVTDGRPIFFGHKRVGYRGREFKCLKFRTMCRDADQRLSKHLLENPAARVEWEARRKLSYDPRISRIGNFLRKSSLDELPQLLNILAGQMSIVGPRPIVEDESKYYGQDYQIYKSVRPGLTGLWQVCGRSDVGYDERVELDVEYVFNQSFSGDLKIIGRTFKVVLNRNGAQ